MPVLINDDFLFLHLPKCAGQFVTLAMQQKLGRMRLHDDHFRSGHAPLVMQHAKDRAKLVFGLVRNPWDWYVSYYHYFMTKLGPSPMEMQGFCNALNPEPGTNVPPFKAVLERMLFGPVGKVVAHGHNRLKTHVRLQADMQRHDIGFFSWCYLWHHLPSPGLILQRDDVIIEAHTHDELVGPGTNVIIPSERCKDGLIALFDASSSPLSEQEKLTIVHLTPINTNQGNVKHGRLPMSGTVKGMYDTESLEWVRDQDRIIVERFGYDGPGSGPSEEIFPIAVRA